MLSGLNSDSKVRVCVVVAGVLVCLFVFWCVAAALVSSTSLCCSTSSRKRSCGKREGQCKRYGS